MLILFVTQLLLPITETVILKQQNVKKQVTTNTKLGFRDYTKPNY